MSLIDFCKKYLLFGLISQVIITGIAGVVAMIEGVIAFILAVIVISPGGKYGPPPDPDMPIVKYGAPVDPATGAGQFDPAALVTMDNVIAGVVILASLVLYAWAFLGWIFWGSILYLKAKGK